MPLARYDSASTATTSVPAWSFGAISATDFIGNFSLTNLTICGDQAAGPGATWNISGNFGWMASFA